MSFLEILLQDIDKKKQYSMLIFGDFFLRSERGFVQCCGSIVFLNAPATATTASSQKQKMFSVRKLTSTCIVFELVT